MQKPSLGRVVLTLVEPTMNNGCDVAPAVICRVWGDGKVNLRVLCDGPSVLWLTSVPLVETREEAETVGQPHVAYWPPRV